MAHGDTIGNPAAANINDLHLTCSYRRGHIKPAPVGRNRKTDRILRNGYRFGNLAGSNIKNRNLVGSGLGNIKYLPIATGNNGNRR
ncbi:hypothetical protein ES703_60756 [subsurface metagenome]